MNRRCNVCIACLHPIFFLFGEFFFCFLSPILNFLEYNKKLEKMINTLWEQVQRFRITYVSDSNASLSLIDEHQCILNAIKEGNIADSKKFAIKHIEKAEQFMLEHCTK